jgi:hypothetical protein
MNHARKWAMVAVLAVAMLVPAAVFAANTDLFGPNVTWPVTLNLTFCWDGSSCGTAQWYLNQNRTFTDSYGYTGTWSFNRSTGEFHVLYEAGCYPDYAGYPSGMGYLQGEMNCRSGSGHGTWTATRAAGPIKNVGNPISPK